MHVPRLWLTASLGLVSVVALQPVGQAPFAITSPVGESSLSAGAYVSNSTIGKPAKHHCEDIHEAADPCAYAREYCSPESAGMVDYIAWYYCDMQDAQPVAFSLLVGWTALLFSTIGIASSDFFCPNLATIANSLGMSQSVAGVTFLAFGNGSPDVFSTFAAFKAHSGSLAIGELLGAAAFITSVVAGAMAIIAPFKVSRRSFLRDAGFFMVAVIMTMFLLADGVLRLWESILMIVFYAIYVAYVLIGTYINSKDNRKKVINSRIRSRYAQAGDEPGAGVDDDLDDEANRLLDEDRRDMSNIEIDNHESDEEHDYQDFNNSMSITGRPLLLSNNSVRPSLLGALEFRELVSNRVEDPPNSQNMRKSKLRRPRAHSSACTKPTEARKENGRTRSGTIVKLLPSQALAYQRSQAEPSCDNQPRADDTDRLGRVRVQPLSIVRTSSRSSSRSENEMPNDQIASASLRKHNPIELLSPVIPDANHAVPSSDIPVINVEGPGDESDPFSEAWADDSHMTSGVQSYNAVTNVDRSASESASPAESAGSDDGCNCVRDEKWLPVWWPYKVLPPPGELVSLLFPTLDDFRDQSYTQRLLSIMALPSVFILTVTLPVVNPPVDQKTAELNEDGQDLEAVIAKDDAERYTAHRGWNRWLTALQSILAPLLLSTAIFYDSSLLWPTVGALLTGAFLVTLVLLLTTDDKRPKFHTWFCFVGFAISVCWISTIANEVVGTLQAFGTILGISDAILGLTVFAVGNSLGDFVADVTVARMGFSQMAISGVFGGPMLNILMGIGISGIYINLSK